MTSSSDRLNRIEALLERFIDANVTDRQASNERITRIEQSMQEGSQRMTQIEQSMLEGSERLTRIEQITESNNRFLESFSTDLRRYTDSMNNLATRIDGVIATSN